MIAKVTLEMTSQGEFVLEDGADCRNMNPKALLLYAGAKCAGLTALKIMKQERIEPERFEISLSGELSTDEVQAGSVFRSFNAVYNVECARYEDQAKVSHAVNLAHEKYCGTIRMLRQIAPVSHEIAIVSNQPADA